MRAAFLCTDTWVAVLTVGVNQARSLSGYLPNPVRTVRNSAERAERAEQDSADP
jgi:hypothetical protein